MKSHLLKLWCAFCVALPLAAFGQGSLTPPGTPAPTMKSLDQVASTGIPIDADHLSNDASNHFIIGSPGSYYLPRNLTVTKTNGIEITAPDVTIDLNGFEIARNSGVGGAAIKTLGLAHRFTIKNGSITGIGGNTFQSAVQCDSSTRSGAFLDLTVSGVASGSGNGALESGIGYVIERCRVHGSSGFAGIFARGGSTISHCTASAGTFKNGIFAGEGCALDHCAVFDNTSETTPSAGINAGAGNVLVGCVVRSNNVSPDASGTTTAVGILLGSGTMKDCSATNNDGDGIQAGSAGPVTIEGCTAHTNQGNGISTVADGSVISTCAVSLNGKKAAQFNTAADGIRITARTRVVNCTSFNNAHHGIENTSNGNRAYIEGCIMQGNGGFAIALPASTNVIVHNQVGGNSGGGINQSGGNIAPVQNASDSASTMHPLANYP